MIEKNGVANGVTRWWLVRHAPVKNPGALLYGSADMEADLSDTARLRATASVLPSGAVWVASHLSRAIDTAHCLHEFQGWQHARPDRSDAWDKRVGSVSSMRAEANLALTKDSDLAEQNFGEWEKCRWDELPPAQTALFWTDFARQSPPGGESFADVVTRVGAAIDRIGRDHAGGDIIAVMHGGSIRAALAHVLGLSLDAALAFHIDTLAVTRLEHFYQADQPGWRITGVNLRMS